MNILIIDDHDVARAGLKLVLSEADIPFEFGEAATASEAMQLLHDKTWDVVILDISLPDLNGIELLKRIKTHWKKLPVLIMSGHSEDEYAVRAIRSGAAGYLVKTNAMDKMLSAIRKVTSGGRYIDAELAEKLAISLDEVCEGPAHKGLSDREYEVMCLIASGMTLTEISKKVSLSVKTISTYRARIMAKMEMRNNAQLTHYAIKHSLVD